MIYVYYFFAAVLAYLSYRSFRGGIEYLSFFRESLASPRSDYFPFASVIVPCRGIDDGMDENLTAFMSQDYPGYEVIFVVDGPNDPAVTLINRAISGSSPAGTSQKTTSQTVTNLPAAKLAVAPKARRTSQKVENLREAVLHVDNRSEVFIFADSDVRPTESWLRGLVGPLADPSVGAVTGYRWFISKTPSFGSELRSVWNASVASVLGKNTGSNFTWGGSMALRRDVFEHVKMREQWIGTLSDDFAVTRVLKAAGLPIVFVPLALSASIENCNFGQMLEFTNRQMKITRVYSTPLWVASFIGSGIFCCVMLAALLLAAFSGRNSVEFWFSLATVALVSIFSIGKAWLRLRAVELVLEEYRAEIQRQYWTQCTLWILAPAIFFINSLTALLSRRMKWRGTTYELKSPRETVIIAD